MERVIIIKDSEMKQIENNVTDLKNEIRVLLKEYAMHEDNILVGHLYNISNYVDDLKDALDIY